MTKTDNNKSLYFFINPISGKGVAKKIFTKVSKTLCASGIDIKPVSYTHLTLPTKRIV